MMFCFNMHITPTEALLNIVLLVGVFCYALYKIK